MGPGTGMRLTTGTTLIAFRPPICRAATLSLRSVYRDRKSRSRPTPCDSIDRYLSDRWLTRRHAVSPHAGADRGVVGPVIHRIEATGAPLSNTKSVRPL